MEASDQFSDSRKFRATSGTVQGFGETPRAALDALLTQQADALGVPIVIWPFNQGDAFFSNAQQERLQDLKNRRASLNANECAELEQLVEASFDATVARTKSLQQRKS